MDLGGERLETEFDLVKITKQLRNLKELMNEKGIWDKSLKFAIKHSGMNVIKLDGDRDDPHNSGIYSHLDLVREDTVNQVME